MYPTLTAAALHLEAERAVIDGEIVALGPDGRPSFQALQHRGSSPGHQIVFYAFDVLHADGRDVTDEPPMKRRARLASIVGEHSTLRLSQFLPGTAADVVAALRAAGLEGVIAKRKDSIYQPGERSGDWLKLKLEHEQSSLLAAIGLTAPGESMRCSSATTRVGTYASPARCALGWSRTSVENCSASSVRFKSKNAPSLTFRMPSLHAGAAVSRRNRCQRCTGRARNSSRKSGSWNGQQKDGCATPPSWGFVTTRPPRTCTAGTRVSRNQRAATAACRSVRAGRFFAAVRMGRGERADTFITA
jgi:hypothetical protein